MIFARFIALLLLALLPAAADPATDAPAFEHGNRPASGIFDPSGFLTPEVSGQIARPLAGYRANESIDVVVVILETIGDAPPEHVARQFADAWCDGLLNCLVLHVPRHPDGPWIVPGGRIVRDTLDPKNVAISVAAAERRASLEPTEAGKVRAAAIEAADLLRIWMGFSLMRSDFIREQQIKYREVMEKRDRWRKLLVPALLTSLVAVSLLAYFLIGAKTRLRSRKFPQPVINRRLGAPHAGGNDACIDLGPTTFPDNPPDSPPS